MEKVKEEFFLSLIFVGKWIVLGLGIVGILYVAINLAYHKSYYDPLIGGFDLELSELTERRAALLDTKNTLVSTQGKTDLEIKEYEEVLLPAAGQHIEKAKQEIEALGLRWWNRLPNPLKEEDKRAREAFNTLDEAEERYSSLNRELDGLLEAQVSNEKSIASVSTEIQEIEGQILDTTRDKKRAEVDVKGPILWLVGLLGLT